MRFPVACADCLWTGRRQWPGPKRPCPHCGGEVVRARVPRSTRSGPGFGNQTDGHGGWVTWT